MRRLVCEYYNGFSFGTFVGRFPHLRGTLTDLLVGDLFTDRVDEVWEPMESMYEPGASRPATWDSGAREIANDKEDQLAYPDATKPQER